MSLNLCNFYFKFTQKLLSYIYQQNYNAYDFLRISF